MVEDQDVLEPIACHQIPHFADWKSFHNWVRKGHGLQPCRSSRQELGL